GYLGGGDDRAQAGLSRSRPTAVISDLAVLGFDPGSKRMRLEALQPGVTVDEVVANTGFELLIASSVRELAPASPEELTELARIRGDDGAELPERATAR
ncbi:MAG: CoA-transferase, partial [Actinomycetota bacterium]